jgi:hypothetical protein
MSQLRGCVYVCPVLGLCDPCPDHLLGRPCFLWVAVRGRLSPVTGGRRGVKVCGTDPGEPLQRPGVVTSTLEPHYHIRVALTHDPSSPQEHCPLSQTSAEGQEILVLVMFGTHNKHTHNTLHTHHGDNPKTEYSVTGELLDTQGC